MSNPYWGLKSDISQTYEILQTHSSLRTKSTMFCKALVHPSHQEVKSCNILNWAECWPIRTISIRSWAKTRFAIQLWNQEVKSCKTPIEQNFNQSELFQPGHEPRLDLHTTLEPGSELLQDPKLSKSCSKSQTSLLGQELQLDLHTMKSLILQLQENFLKILCQYYWSKYILKFVRIKWNFIFRI